MKLSTRMIAARLREAAHTLPDLPMNHAEVGVYTLQIGTFKITCRGTRDAVRNVADKYEKGPRSLRAWSGLPPREPLAKPTLRRPANADALLAELLAECGEVEPECECYGINLHDAICPANVAEVTCAA